MSTLVQSDKQLVCKKEQVYVNTAVLICVIVQASWFLCALLLVTFPGASMQHCNRSVQEKGGANVMTE